VKAADAEPKEVPVGKCWQVQLQAAAVAADGVVSNLTACLCSLECFNSQIFVSITSATHL
jgi:hypothetical protein